MTTTRGWRRAPSAAAAIALLALLTGTAPAPATEAGAAPPGALTFVGRNYVATANGTFHSWRITRSHVDPSDLANGVVEVEVDVASLDTDNQRRDDHLRSADFFEVERWPTATARVHSARPDGEDEKGRARYAARFDLTIRGTTRTVDGTFVVIRAEPLAVEGALTIDRNAWGIGAPKRRFNPMSIEDEIPIRFRAEIPVGSPAGAAQDPEAPS